MVEYNATYLDNIFLSLADPTRRDILSRLTKGEVLSIGEIADHYNLTFAAISKHLKVLEKARLVAKDRKGLKQMVRICPETLHDADTYLKQYEALWKQRFDRLEQLINNEE
jgi:DNA-binding transcriptional ArsR family regulator